MLAALLPACSAEPGDAPPVELDVPISTEILGNGLEVVVAPNHLVTEVTAVVAFHAGAFTEDASTNGYSHLFEHMIFDGSMAVPDPVEFRDQLNALGVRANATTGVDQVTYFFTAQTSALDPALGLFAGALRQPALLDEQLEREKQVVLGEFDLDEADYDFLRYRRMLRELYGDYATRVSPLGSRDAVTAATSDELRQAHDRYYVPNNAVLVLSGDITTRQGRSLASTYFGDWAQAPDPLRANPPPDPAPLAWSRYVVLEAPISNTRITIGFLCDAAKDDPKAAMAGQLLSEVTYQSDHSFRQLVSTDLATSASFDVVTGRFSTYVTVGITVPVGAESRVLSIARDVLGSIALPGDVSRAQLGQAKDARFADHFYEADNPDSLAHAVAGEWADESVETYENYADDLYAVGLGDLDRFAAGCVRKRPRAVVLLSSHENVVRQGFDEGLLEEAL